MCVANTGKILSIDSKKNTASVDFRGSRINARMGLADVKVGDRVLVHAGCILQKVSDEQYEEWVALVNEIENETEEA